MSLVTVKYAKFAGNLKTKTQIKIEKCGNRM